MLVEGENLLARQTSNCAAAGTVCDKDFSGWAGHIYTFSPSREKKESQIPSALPWWASALKRAFSNYVLSWVWCLPSFSLSHKKLAFLYDCDTKMLWDLVGVFFNCTGRAAVSGQGRSVVCSWILAPWSCVRHLCSLGLCWDAAGWAGIQCPLLCTEEPLKFSSLALKPFLQGMTFIFPFLLYPHNLIVSQVFSLCLRKRDAALLAHPRWRPNAGKVICFLDFLTKLEG